MPERPKFFDDLAGVAGGAMSAFAGLREELTAAARARVDETVRRMDLIKRDEFEAMAELAKRTREQLDKLELRVAALEGKAAAETPVAHEPMAHEPVMAAEVAPEPAPEPFELPASTHETLPEPPVLPPAETPPEG
jgi:BMFP domain-containing protein YqiC